MDTCPRLQSSQQQVSYEWQGGSTAACKRLAAWPPADPAPKRHHQVTSGLGGSAAAAAAAPQWQRDAEPDGNEDEGLEAEEDASSPFMASLAFEGTSGRSCVSAGGDVRSISQPQLLQTA